MKHENDDRRLANLAKEMEERGLAVDFRSPEEIEAARIRLNRNWLQKLWAAIKRWWARWRYRDQEFTLAELDAAQGPPGSLRTAGEIDQALKDLKGRNYVNPEHTKFMPWADPGRYTPGYDPERGVTVHRDSVVIRPYIGSKAEEEDAQRPIMPRRASPPKGRMNCPKCLGWGWKNAWAGVGKSVDHMPLVDCDYCKGKGWV